MAKVDKAIKPTFLIQAEAFVDRKFKDADSIKDPKYGPGLSSFDHKVFIGIMDLQMDHVNSVLIEGFRHEVAEHYGPIMNAINKLDSKIDKVSEELKEIKIWQIKAEKRLFVEESKTEEFENRLQDKKRRIECLEKKEELLEQEIKEIKPEIIHKFLLKIDEITPKLDLIVATQSPKEINKRIAKAVIISITIATVITILALGIHKKRTSDNIINKVQTEQSK